MTDTKVEVGYSKTELVRELEGYGDVVVDPDEFSWAELAEKLRYHRCQSCISYEDKKGCDRCAKEIAYEVEDRN